MAAMYLLCCGGGGNWPLTFSDALVLFGLALTLFLYRLERHTSDRSDLRDALAALQGARNGMEPWATLYFRTNYDEKTARTRAHLDYDAVMRRGHGIVYRVPTDGVSALIDRLGQGIPARAETIEAINIALWQIGKFNQLVQQQTDFHATHLPEIMNPQLPEANRIALATAAESISFLLHFGGISNGMWYQSLLDELSAESASLGERLGRRWWNDRFLVFFAVPLAISVLLAARSLVA
jgi:hypothetical protein